MPTSDTRAETADSVRQAAEQHRAQAEAARAEADTIVTAARAQAEALITAATSRATELQRQATAADRAAAPLEERASHLHAAEQLHEQIPNVHHMVGELAAEAERLAENVEALDVRLADLGEERETIGMQLAGAREAGSVDEVLAARTRVAAVDEVVAALTNRRQAALDRLEAIGDTDSGGEYARAVQLLHGLHGELRKVENWLDPQRPEAVQDRLLDDVQAAIAGNLQRIAEERETPQQPRRNTNHIVGR